jgi:hypothetical protein
MKKSILSLDGTKLLSKNELKSVLGGIHICATNGCPSGFCCTKVGCKVNGTCP